jgi:hypothetical protein
LNKPVLLSLNGGAFQASTGLLQNDTVSKLFAEFKDFASIKKLGSNCCTIVVAPGYSVNDGNGGRNYNVSLFGVVGSINAKLPGASTGDAASSASADAVKSGFTWSNGRSVSGEGKTSVALNTVDTLQWNVTDPQGQKRIQLTCDMLGGICGQERIGRSSSFSPTRSYQVPGIEFK